MLSDDIAKPRAILVSVCLPSDDFEHKQWSLNELEQLAATAGIETVGKVIQRRKKINSSLYVGTGFLNGIRDEMTKKDAELLIFDNPLAPNQGRNLQKRYDIDAIDRTEVILQVFQNHARTPESQMQVRLAELEYQLPRLKALWSHLDRQRGSSGSAGAAGGRDGNRGADESAVTGSGRGVQRGTGEKQIEIDRRLIIREITQIKKKLIKVDRRTQITGKKRALKKKVCLIGYTNAGKSTLFNRLTQASVLVADKLFATLDSTARSLDLGKGREIILSDTVGFISDLPHHLVASFRATLKEVVDADLLLHVVDLSNSKWEHHIDAVGIVLKSIGANSTAPLYVFNKLDLLQADDDASLQKALKRENAVTVSATQGTNIDRLIQQIDDTLNASQVVDLLIPFVDSKLIDWLYRYGDVKSKDYKEEGIFIRALLNADDIKKVEKYAIA